MKQLQVPLVGCDTCVCRIWRRPLLRCVVPTNWSFDNPENHPAQAIPFGREGPLALNDEWGVEPNILGRGPDIDGEGALGHRVGLFEHIPV